MNEGPSTTLLSFAAGIPVVGSFFEGALNLVAPGAIAAARRADTWRNNRGVPNMAPSAEAIISAYHRGLFGEVGSDGARQWLSTGLIDHGISYSPVYSNADINLTGGWDRFWNAIDAGNMKYPSIDALIWLYIHGMLSRVKVPKAVANDDERFAYLMKVLGMGGEGSERYLLDRQTALTPSQIIYRFGALTDGSLISGTDNYGYAKLLWQQTGLLPARWNAEVSDRRVMALEKFASNVDAQNAVSAVWRRAWSDDEYSDYLRRNGSLLSNDFAAATIAKNPLPGLTEIIGAITRGTTKAPYVNLAQLDGERTPEYDELARWHGMAWSADMLPQRDGNNKISFADLLWRNKWRTFSQGEISRGITRLNVRDVGKWRDVVSPNVIAFDPDFAREALARDNVPPGMRDTMIALSYAPIGLRATQRIFRLLPTRAGEISRLLSYYGGDADPVEDKVEKFTAAQARDAGLAPQDSLLIGKMAGLQAEVTLDAPRVRRGLSLDAQEANQWESLYEDGLIPRDKLIDELSRLWGDINQAQQSADMIDRKIDASDFKLLVSRIRSDYFGGEYNGQQANDLLVSSGMVPARAIQTVSRWSVVFHRKRRVLETGKIQSMVRNGLMSNDAAYIRLSNMGWTNADSLLLGLETAQNVARDQARLATATQRQVLSAQREQVKALKETQRQVARMNPPAKLLKLYDTGQISLKTASGLLTAQGYTPQGIQVWLAASKPDRHLSKADFASLVSADVITETEYRAEMAGLGYDNQSIEFEWQLISAKAAKAAAKPAAKAKATAQPGG
jgi:hypothetical protein